jgi:hypothetical protein
MKAFSISIFKIVDIIKDFVNRWVYSTPWEDKNTKMPFFKITLGFTCVMAYMCILHSKLFAPLDFCCSCFPKRGHIT